MKNQKIIIITGENCQFIVIKDGEKETLNKKISYFTYDDLQKNFPNNFVPDIIVFFTPEYHFIPIGVEKSDAFLIACVSDWNVNFIHLLDTLKSFDFILTDLNGKKTFISHGFENVDYFPIFSLNFTECENNNLEKEFDVIFIGNTNHNIQVERAKYLYELAKLATYYNVIITYGIYGKDYINLLSKSKIVFNKTIRSELNVRTFEVFSAGSLLFLEEDNIEANYLLSKNQNYVSYNYENLNEKIEYYLNNPSKLENIIKKGNDFIKEKNKEYFNDQFIAKIIDVFDKNSKINNSQNCTEKTKIIFNNVFFCVENFQENLLLKYELNSISKNYSIENYNTFIVYKYLVEKDKLDVLDFLYELEEKMDLYPKYLPLKINYLYICIENKLFEQSIDFIKNEIETINESPKGGPVSIKSKESFGVDTNKTSLYTEKDFKGLIITEKYSRFFIELEKNFANKKYDKNIFIWKLYNLLGDLNYIKGDFYGALESYKSATNILETSVIVGKKGKINYILGDLETAYNNYQKSFELDIFNYENFNNLIELEEETNYELSNLEEKTWLSVIDALPNYKEICKKYPFYKIKSLEYKKNCFNIKDSVYLAEKIISEDSKYIPAVMKKAEDLFSKKEYEKAIEILAEIINEDKSEKSNALLLKCIEEIDAV